MIFIEIVFAFVSPILCLFFNFPILYFSIFEEKSDRMFESGSDFSETWMSTWFEQKQKFKFKLKINFFVLN